MVVVAVDLGTTHSGYAFSFSRDPASVYVMSRWAGQEPGLLNHKTLSALLLTPDGRFHSFGLAARNHYHNLLPIEARLWLYFERFKMTLHHCKVCLFVFFFSPQFVVLDGYSRLPYTTARCVYLLFFFFSPQVVLDVYSRLPYSVVVVDIKP